MLSPSENTAEFIRALIEDIAGLIAISILFVAGLALPLWF